MRWHGFRGIPLPPAWLTLKKQRAGAGESEVKGKKKMKFRLVSVTMFDCEKAIIMTYRLPYDSTFHAWFCRGVFTVQSTVWLLLKSNLFIVFRKISRIHIAYSQYQIGKRKISIHLCTSTRVLASVLFHIFRRCAGNGCCCVSILHSAEIHLSSSDFVPTCLLISLS